MKKYYSKLNEPSFCTEAREQKGKTILEVIKDFSSEEFLKNAVVLDIGGSAGFIAKELTPYVKDIYVVDIDEKALQFGKKHNRASNIHYQLGDAMDLSFPDKSMDIIICNQVYEHVLSSQQLVKEIYRILNDDGMCYFGARNKFALIEPHCNLPFLSWLPKNLANLYLKISKKICFDVNLLSYYELMKLFKLFKVHDYTIKIIKNPIKYYKTDLIKQGSLITKIPTFLLNTIKPIMPSYIFILTKKEQ